jgi:hypothetical protein
LFPSLIPVSAPLSLGPSPCFCGGVSTRLLPLFYFLSLHPFPSPALPLHPEQNREAMFSSLISSVGYSDSGNSTFKKRAGRI